METQAKDSALLPPRRVEIGVFDETYKRTGRKMGKRPATDREDTHRTVRREIYAVTVPVRVCFRSDDEAWLNSVSEAFELKLPRYADDGHGSAMYFSMDKAERGGFERKTVEVMRKLSRTLHLRVIGSVTTDSDVPLIRDVTFNPSFTEAS